MKKKKEQYFFPSCVRQLMTFQKANMTDSLFYNVLPFQAPTEKNGIKKDDPGQSKGPTHMYVRIVSSKV